MNGLQQNINRMTNAWNELLVALGKSGVISVVSQSLETFGVLLRWLPDAIEGVSLAASQEIDKIGPVADPDLSRDLIIAIDEVADSLETLREEQEELNNMQSWADDNAIAQQESHIQRIKERIKFQREWVMVLRQEDKLSEQLHGNKMERLGNENDKLEDQAKLTKELAAEQKAIDASQKRYDENAAQYQKGEDALMGLIDDYEIEIKIKKALLKVDESRRDVLEEHLRLHLKLQNMAAANPLIKGQEGFDEFNQRRDALWKGLEPKVFELWAENKSLDQQLDDGKKKVEDFGMTAEDVFDNFSTSFGDAAESIILGTERVSDAFGDMLASLASDVLQASVMDPLKDVTTGFISGFGKTLAGTLFPSLKIGKEAANGLVQGGGVGLPHGVYSAPTAFPINGPSRAFARGVGLMGEAGPEAIMPLRRGADGKLGVSGGGAVINIHNNAPGVDVSAEQPSPGAAIEIVVARIANDIARGGTPVSRSIEGAYNVTRGRRMS
jgi:hypothetical protein